ncbi:hypothetical protein R1flu_000704 [Riccia fluitans]|uniref:Uncharacterized protein n=1 Tax=Riccia fluitans TaxID=41844 RepID=A0ABD1Y252_9MARC
MEPDGITLENCLPGSSASEVISYELLLTNILPDVIWTAVLEETVLTQVPLGMRTEKSTWSKRRFCVVSSCSLLWQVKCKTS